MYTCTGTPEPEVIRNVIESMMEQEFTTAFECATICPSSRPSLAAPPINCLAWPFADIQAIKADKGLALQDLVVGAYDFVATLELTAPARVYLLDQLAQTE